MLISGPLEYILVLKSLFIPNAILGGRRWVLLSFLLYQVGIKSIIQGGSLKQARVGIFVVPYVLN